MKRSLFIFLMALLSFDLTAQSAREMLKQAEEMHREGKFDQAITLYSKVITAAPSESQAYLGRAQVREQVRDFGGALTDYSLYLELDPDKYDALLGRANVRFRVGQYEEAMDDYRKLLTLPAGETNMVMFQKSPSAKGTRQITTAQSNLKPALYSYIGMTAYKLQRYPEALAWLDSAIRLEPREADYYVNRGLVHEKTDIKKAVGDYEYALSLNPTHTQALNNLGVLTGRSGKENDYFDRAIESDSSMLAPYLERAYQRMQGGFFKGALEDYNSAIAIEKRDPEIWLNRGFVKERLNDLKGAYADYTEALKLDRSFEKAWLNRGNALSKMNRYAEAVEDYSAAITFNAEYGPAFYNRAVAREKLKQKLEACADLQRAQELGVDVDPKLKTAVCK